MKLNKHQKIILSIALLAFLSPWFQLDFTKGRPAFLDWSILIHWFSLTVATSWFVYLSSNPRKYILVIYVVFIILYFIRASGGPFYI